MQELKTLADKAQRTRNKDFILLQIRKLETELGGLNAVSVPTSTYASVPAAGNMRYESELTQYAFDQSDKFVKLFVTLSGVEKVPEENVSAEFTPNSLVLTIKDLNNRDYKLQINNLLESIDVSKSYRKLKTGMVVIYAKKLKEGIVFRFDEKKLIKIKIFLFLI